MTSQLPWKVKDKYVVISKEKTVVNTYLGCPADKKQERKWQANAAFIVKACNNHERLVEACKKAIIQLEYLDSRFPTSTTPAEINWIKQALQSAEE
jgi:hypothetical protein